jgi:hypothetical protein
MSAAIAVLDRFERRDLQYYRITRWHDDDKSNTVSGYFKSKGRARRAAYALQQYLRLKRVRLMTSQEKY